MQLAELLEARAIPDQRGESRRQIRLIADCSLPAQAGRRVLIAEISGAGMRIKTQARLPIGEEIEFCLPGVQSVGGEVMWQRDIDYGIRFASPLSAASLAAALLVSPAEVPPARADTDTRPAQTSDGKDTASKDRPHEPELRDRDLFWILPLLGLVYLWFVIVDAVFAVEDGIARRR